MTTFPQPNFPTETVAAAKQAALDAFPNESCGLIVSGQYVPCTNIATDPAEDFKIDPQAIIDAGSNLQCILHSHPKTEAEPSGADQEGQIATDVIWGIIKVRADGAEDPLYWGDYRLEEPLIGRPFIHGITDCYGLIRSWFWQVKGIKIMDIPRNPLWWDNGGDIYTQKFAEAGFVQITAQEVQDEDFFLGKVNSPVPNHGGVIISASKGLAMHHLMKRLSRREPILPWQKFITHYLRYTGGQ